VNAVIYARYSSDGQREESIEGQLRECKEYAERHNITVISTYIDRALSAKTDDRPEFQNMIRDSAKKQFEVALVWKLDRFSRNRLTRRPIEPFSNGTVSASCRQKRTFPRDRRA
jgi:DNA invertase Pin-like site-specific DNA recombinase